MAVDPQTDPLPPLRPKSNLLAFFGGSGGHALSDDGSTTSSVNPPPSTNGRRPKRKTAAASDALTQLQLGALRATQDEVNSELSAGDNSEAGPSSRTGWKLAPPTTAMGPEIKDKAKRRRRVKDDELAEVSSMISVRGKQTKAKAKVTARARKVTSDARVEGSNVWPELDMIDPDLGDGTADDHQYPPTPKRARRRKAEANGVIDVSNDSPTRPSPTKRPPYTTTIQRPNAAGPARKRGKGVKRETREGTTASESGTGTLIGEDEGDGDEIELLRDSMTIEDSPPPISSKPRAYATLWTGRPAHPFFGGGGGGGATKPAEDFPPAEGLVQLGQDDDVELPEVPDANLPASPVKPMPKTNRAVPPGRVVHGFFGAGTSDASASVNLDEGNAGAFPVKRIDGWGRGAGDAAWARYPDGEEQHVGREASLARSGPSAGLPRRERNRSVMQKDNGEFWSRIHTRATRARPSAPMLDDRTSRLAQPLSTAHSTHPAITRITDGLVARFNHENWVERYRPTMAEEVLGNERQAGYLVDWLKELAIGSSSGAVGGATGQGKRNVVRKVHPLGKVKAAKEQDWIVDDSLDPIEDYGTNDQGPVTPSTAHLGPPSVDLAYPSLDSRLANSILISGPTGSGKTAAVHAAATELGWEVFEVYPGIGKRSGEALRSLVGDVGKNHMVGKGHANGGPPASPQPIKEKRNGVGGFFTKGGVKKDEETPAIDLTRPLESTIGFIEVDADAAEMDGTATASAAGTKAKFRQSLILLEEVDVLYKEDQGFWQGVVGLIAESKRPVVMTCSDIAGVPLPDLPLQTELRFVCPPLDLALQYLSAVAEHEEVTPSSEYLPSLAENRRCRRVAGLDVLGDIPLAPCTDHRDNVAGAPGIDLRGCIAQMQYDLGCPAPGPSNSTATAATMKGETNRVERTSFADAFLGRRLTSFLDANEIDRMKPSDDDEVKAMNEHHVLKPRPKDAWTSLASFTREEEFMSELLPIHDTPRSDLGLDRARYQHATLAFLEPMLPLEGYLLPHPSIFTDVIPGITWMVAIDDALELEDKARADKGEERVNRKTGRWMRIGGAGEMAYERQLVGLQEEELAVVRQTRLAPLQDETA